MNFLLLFVSCSIFLQYGGKANTVREVISTKSISNPIFNNRTINEENIITYSLKSKIQCTSRCRETRTCLSVSYNTVTQTCVLFDKDFTDTSSTVCEIGWQYLYVIKDSEQRGPHCVGPSLTGICSLYCISYIVQPGTFFLNELADTCESYSGGELVKIDRGLKQYCVEQLLENEINGEVFIQGRKTQNVWRYNDGSEMKFFNWNTAGWQPENRPNEFYIIVRKSNGYVWHDMYDDDGINAAVCQQT